MINKLKVKLQPFPICNLKICSVNFAKIAVRKDLVNFQLYNDMKKNPFPYPNAFIAKNHEFLSHVVDQI